MNTDPLTVRRPIARGHEVILCRIEPEHAEWYVTLRNRLGVRSRFLDDRQFDVEQARAWIERMEWPHEALLVMLVSDRPVGVIGWQSHDCEPGAAEFGRLIADSAALRTVAPSLPKGYPGIAIDAMSTLREYAFIVLGLECVRSSVLPGNTLSMRANTSIGLEPTATVVHERSDGTSIEVTHMSLSRERWQTLERWNWQRLDGREEIA